MFAEQLFPGICRVFTITFTWTSDPHKSWLEYELPSAKQALLVHTQLQLNHQLDLSDRLHSLHGFFKAPTLSYHCFTNIPSLAVEERASIITD